MMAARCQQMDVVLELCKQEEPFGIVSCEIAKGKLQCQNSLDDVAYVDPCIPLLLFQASREQLCWECFANKRIKLGAKESCGEVQRSSPAVSFCPQNREGNSI
jgi:hypothetical protein